MYLGTYGSEVQAARGHDIAALRANPATCSLNFPRQDYAGVIPLIIQLPQVRALGRGCGLGRRLGRPLGESVQCGGRAVLCCGSCSLLVRGHASEQRCWDSSA